MRLETFSYLPELSGEQLEQQIRSILDRHLVVGIEYTDRARPATTTTGRCGSCRCSIPTDPAAVLAELEACRQANPGAYIKVNGYDRSARARSSRSSRHSRNR